MESKRLLSFPASIEKLMNSLLELSPRRPETRFPGPLAFPKLLRSNLVLNKDNHHSREATDISLALHSKGRIERRKLTHTSKKDLIP
jgi:hypothetical protein